MTGADRPTWRDVWLHPFPVGVALILLPLALALLAAVTRPPMLSPLGIALLVAAGVAYLAMRWWQRWAQAVRREAQS